MQGIPREVERQALTVKEAAEAMGLGERSVWDLVHDGMLRSVQVGRRRIVPIKAIDEFLNGEQVAS